MSNEKDLDYYIANPDEVDPGDHELIKKLMVQTASEGSVEEDTTAPTDKGSEDEAKSDKEAETKVEAKADADDKAQEAAKPEPKSKDDEPAGVATKDGKHVIPFSVLESERTQRANAEAKAEAAQREAAEVRAQLNAALKSAGVSAKAEPGKLQDIEKLDATIAELKEESPFMAEALEAMRDQLVATNARAAKAEESYEALQRAQQESAKKEVADAVANNPALTLWSSEAEAKPDIWNDAIRFDNQLRESPAWANKPTADRLAKVAELVASVHGADVLPPGYDPASVGKKQTTTAAPSKSVDATKTKEIAAAKLKNAASVATTLSDIPGGDAVEVNQSEAVEKMSVHQLGAMFMNMSPAKQRAYLAKL